MLVKIDNIEGELIKDNETYALRDNTLLNNLVVSSTDLKPYQSTNGHTHPGQEEVYYFVKGAGTMYLDDIPRFVEAGDVVLIEDGVHHRVSCGPQGLYFVCVFDGKRNH
ncbi:cupin domain-containing protein [bacterium]|nr:cupin domain-containing protein [bacterium]|tara:strand:- start:16 stop:342 length:327 start_codon:yes stop_codon:yes gene_type:complete